MISRNDFNQSDPNKTIDILIDEINHLTEQNNYITSNIIIPDIQNKYIFMGIIEQFTDHIKCILFNSYDDLKAPVIILPTNTYKFIIDNKNEYENISISNYQLLNEIAINRGDTWELITIKK
jgi:hypothetical protein